MDDLIKKVIDSKVYKDCLLSECDKNGRKFEYFGAEFMQKETGTKYDYSKCNDTTILELTAQVETLKEQIKKREDFLKMLPIEGVETITSDGEVVTLYPPSKSSTTSIQITFKS
jgi:translation elongation factor EF-Tu-like GTPase